MSPAEAYPLALWALTVWREARGEPYTAKLAIACVIRNRSLDERRRWPHDPAKVCLQPHQFSCFDAGDPNAAKFPAPDDAVFLDCCRAVAEAQAGEWDPSRGANHYHHLPSGREPSWAHPLKLTVVIGKGKFYRL